ncbi:MAG: TIGR03086 family metal-binding protein [Acidimicrobiales bacterium]
MDPVEALQQSNAIVTGLVAGLKPDQGSMPTPCDEWTVNDLLGHMCGGAHMVAGGMEGQAAADEIPDFLAEGPVAAWRSAATHLSEAANPEALAATHAMPFGETPGSAAVSIIVADHLTHAWDLAMATGQDLAISDELAEFAIAAWQPLLPEPGRSSDGFKAAIEIADDAPAIDRLAACTGRQP